MYLSSGFRDGLSCLFSSLHECSQDLVPHYLIKWVKTEYIECSWETRVERIAMTMTTTGERCIEL